jgi:outer membrane beta-barrel protein
MRQTLWREGRFELTPKFGFTLGDAYEHNILPGVLLQYYPLDWLGVGLDLAYGFSVDTDLHERIDSELDNKRDAICPPGALQGAAYEECLAKLGVTDSIGTTSLQTLVTAQVAFIPIRGKMMWFGDLLVHYDTQIAVGAALGILRGEGMDGGFAVGPSVAVTGRLLFNDWLGFSLEVRDFLLDYHEATDQTGTDLPSKFHNHVMISFGLSLNFPQVPRVEEIE